MTVTCNLQEIHPRLPIREPALSQLLRRFTNLRAVNPEEWPMPLRCDDSTLPALLVHPPAHPGTMHSTDHCSSSLSSSATSSYRSNLAGPKRERSQVLLAGCAALCSCMCEHGSSRAVQGLKRLEALALNFDFSPEAVAQLGPLGPHLTLLSYAGDMTKTRSTRSAGTLPKGCALPGI